MKIKFYEVITIFLVLAGLGTMFGMMGKDLEDPYQPMFFYIAYLALILPLSTSMRNDSIKRRLRKTALVTGASNKSLNIKLNQKLKALEKKNIISVEIIDKNNALILYTD